MSDIIEVGKVVGTHGLKGELRFIHWCDDYSAFDNIAKLRTDSGSVFTLVSIKPHKSVALMKLEEINTIEEAEQLKNTVLFANRDEIPLPKDSFFLQDILNLSAFSEDGVHLGEIVDWLEVGSKKTYVLKNGMKQHLIPADFITKQDDKIIIKLIEGLIE